MHRQTPPTILSNLIIADLEIPQLHGQKAIKILMNIFGLAILIFPYLQV